jgi:arylsulfatase A-like enzyme
MRAILVLFDSLNRHMLPPYGGKVVAPNFDRLALSSATFDASYVCSMPCMPARRDIQTGRPNFLHRSWGPMEPYDMSLPELLSAGGIYTHLVSDHYHYWEEGGANYHTKYDTWEIVRGQEGDPWIPRVHRPEPVNAVVPRTDRFGIQDQVNRSVMRDEDDFPVSGVFNRALDFLDENGADDNWFLQVEAFDPHEPFFAPETYQELYPDHYKNYRGRVFDWPPYREVLEAPDEVEHIRCEYAKLVSMCDTKLGLILDQMDKLDLWKDTMLIVATDHGFLLGEHDCWAKCWMPFYEEIARTPFFVWDPRCAVAGERRSALVQPAIDLAPTLLDFFGLETPQSMTGKTLTITVAEDRPVRESAVFGIFGGHVNITDGRYVYMRGVPAGKTNSPLYEYTLMPANMRAAFPIERFSEPLQSDVFEFTKGCYLMKVPAVAGMPGGEEVRMDLSTQLYDLENDPGQKHPINDPAVERRMEHQLCRHLKELEAPAEQWQRLALEKD